MFSNTVVGISDRQVTAKWESFAIGPQMLSLTTFLAFGFVESRGLLMYSKGSTYQSQRYFNLSMITEVLTINYLCRLFSVDMASSGTLPNN